MEKITGAFWIKESKKGTKYMSGVVKLKEYDEELHVVVFKNRHKKTDKSPDYTLIESKPIENNSDDKDFDIDQQEAGGGDLV